MTPLPPPTARLEFRRWTRDDAARAAALWCDPAVMRFLGGPYSSAEVTARIDRELANDAAYGIQYWPIVSRAEGAFVGCCGLKPYVAEERLLEIGFQLLPPFWGGGYAFEAAEAVIAFAFRERDAEALYAGHHPANAASKRLLMRLGFTQIGTHPFVRTGLDHPWWELRRPSRG